MYAPFAQVFDCDLDNFWGRLSKDLDGVVRRIPNNVTGFDYKAFIRTFKFKVSLKQPLKSIKTPLLRAVKAKFGEDGVQVVSGLLWPSGAIRRQTEEIASTDDE